MPVPAATKSSAPKKRKGCKPKNVVQAKKTKSTAPKNVVSDLKNAGNSEMYDQKPLLKPMPNKEEIVENPNVGVAL
jgi:hypothetical protein